MKKEKQEYINSICTYVYKKAMEEYESHNYINCGQLRSCSAEVLETENYFLLRSYNTIVGVMSKRTRELIDVLRFVYGYTAKSAQHITKFGNDYNETKRYTYRNV